MSSSRITKIRDRKSEVPDDFLNEMHKWSLECKWDTLKKIIVQLLSLECDKRKEIFI